MKKQNHKVNGDFVKIIEVERNGISMGQDFVSEGIVVGVGNKVEYIKVGDRVVFDKNHELIYFSKGQLYHYVKEVTIPDVL